MHIKINVLQHIMCYRYNGIKYKAQLQQQICIFLYIIQGVPGGKDNILGGHSIGHSKQKTSYEHVSYSEQFPR
jgi:hypothetical protein